jgi:hypothetical protein
MIRDITQEAGRASLASAHHRTMVLAQPAANWRSLYLAWPPCPFWVRAPLITGLQLASPVGQRKRGS